jgi:dihydrofolate reductase
MTSSNSASLGPQVFQSLEEALYNLNDNTNVAEVFVIGGQ